MTFVDPTSESKSRDFHFLDNSLHKGLRISTFALFWAGIAGVAAWLCHNIIPLSKLTIIGSDNGLSPTRRQAIFWTNPRTLLIGPLGTKSSEILIVFHIFSFKRMHLKMSSGKWLTFWLGLNALTSWICLRKHKKYLHFPSFFDTERSQAHVSTA